MNKKTKNVLLIVICALMPVVMFLFGLSVGLTVSKSNSVTSAYADELKVSTYESGAIMVNPLMTSTYTENGVIHNVNFLSVETFDTRFTFTLDSNNTFYLRYYIIFADGTTADLFNTDNITVTASPSWNEYFDKRMSITGAYTDVIDREFYGKASQDFGTGQLLSIDSYSSAKLTYAEFYYNEDIDMADIYKVEYYSGLSSTEVNSNFLYVNFLDINDTYLFRFAVNCGVVSDKLIRYMNTTSSGSYEQGYQDGYNADKDFIQSDINQSIQDAYYEGYTDGQTSRDSDVERAYTNGFIQGKEFSGNNITLTELFTGIAEVPFGTVKSMLNFELLGLNLASLVTGLLTGLLIVKLIMLLV